MMDRIHLHEECDADRDLAVRVVQMNPDLLYLYYSNDKGFTFYNTKAPREAIRSSARRGLKATHEDLRDLHKEALRRLRCDDGPREGVPLCLTACHLGDGGACCVDEGQKESICYLNNVDEGNTCECGAGEGRAACYIDMRCSAYTDCYFCNPRTKKPIFAC